jgi:hypothetical protein
MAYTKYSLTPADNNAAPPNGAPEGMLPSAVNDTMRDMMSQIRDVGDGIRGGTYTMTAPVITGGSITGITYTSIVITGGSINNTTIGATTASTGAFTTLGATGVATFSAGTVSAPAITTTGDTNTGIFFPAADTIAFSEGGAEVARFNSSGNLQTLGTIGVGNATPSTSGAGITFPATQSASSDANTLDDYEEGTWTPGVAFNGASVGITYGGRQGSYVKVGQMVYASFNIVMTSKGSSTGSSTITGLPFTSGGAVTYPMGVCNTFNLNPTAQTILQISTGGTLMELKFSGLDTNPSNSDFTNATQIRAAFVYQATA